MNIEHRDYFSIFVHWIKIEKKNISLENINLILLNTSK